MRVFRFAPSPYIASESGSIRTVPAGKDTVLDVPCSWSYISTSPSRSRQHPKMSRLRDRETSLTVRFAFCNISSTGNGIGVSRAFLQCLVRYLVA